MKNFLSRLPLRRLVFLIVFLTGIIPLAVSSSLLVRQNHDLLKTQEKSYLTRSAQFLSMELSSSLASSRDQLRQLGETIKAMPVEGGIEEQFAAPWLQQRVASFLEAHPNFLVMRVLNRSGSGPQFAAAPVSAEALEALLGAFEDLFASDRPVYRFVGDAGSGRPAATRRS